MEGGQGGQEGGPGDEPGTPKDRTELPAPSSPNVLKIIPFWYICTELKKHKEPKCALISLGSLNSKYHPGWQAGWVLLFPFCRQETGAQREAALVDMHPCSPLYVLIGTKATCLASNCSQNVLLSLSHTSLEPPCKLCRRAAVISLPEIFCPCAALSWVQILALPCPHSTEFQFFPLGSGG